MNPGVGAGGVAGSHVRNGPALVVGRTWLKLRGRGVPRGHPWSTVKLIVPVAEATNDWTPNGPVTTYVAPGTRPLGRTLTRWRANTICAPAPSGAVPVAPPKPAW